MPFTCSSGYRIEDLNIGSDVAAETCYELFISDKLYEEIAKQTNLYASQKSNWLLAMHLQMNSVKEK